MVYWLTEAGYHTPEALNGYPYWGYVLSILTMGLALTPTSFVAGVSGYLVGWPGLIGVLLAYPLAALLGLGVGRMLYRWLGADMETPRSRAFLNALGEASFRMIFFARLSPVLPFTLTNLLLGRVPLKMGPFLAATMLGMLPRTLLLFLLGMQAGSFYRLIERPDTFSWDQGVTLGLLLLSTLGLWWVIRRALRRQQALLSKDEEAS